jgi:alpha-tubulin suppressor-like RCC1 family protein
VAEGSGLVLLAESQRRGGGSAHTLRGSEPVPRVPPVGHLNVRRLSRPALLAAAAIGALGLFYATAAVAGGPGSLLAWGANTDGALGNGTTTSSDVPVAVSAGAAPAGATFTEVAAGYDHNLALSSTGQVYSWGGVNTYASLGDGSTSAAAVPVAVTGGAIPAGTTFSQIAAGGYVELALASNGRLYSWGYNAFGDLGDGSMSSATSTVPVAVAFSGYSPVKLAIGISQISAGINFGLALASDGAAYGWGDNSSGQLGNGTTTGADTPTAVAAGAVPSGTSFTQVAAGLINSLALGSNGHIYAWGWNGDGQLGDGSTTPSNAPVAVSAGAAPAGTTFTQIAAGGDHGLALSSAGRLYAWGENGEGQLGDGTTTSSDVPVAVSPGAIPSDATITEIAAGYDDSFALTSTGALYAWGSNDEGSLGDGGLDNSDVPVAVELASGTTIAQVARGSTQFHSLAIVQGVSAPFGFHITGVTHSALGAVAKLDVSVTGPCELVGVESARGKRFAVAKVRLAVPQAAVVSLDFTPSAHARAILDRRGKLAVSIKITATPTGGQPSSQTVSETLTRRR